MPHCIHARRLTPPRARLLTAAALLSGVLVAGCGGSSASPTTGAGGGTTTSASTGGGGAPSGALAFAKCMRANGVPNFPDPQSGGGSAFPASAGITSSPAFKAARAACGKLLPGPGGPGGSTFSPQVEAQALAQLRSVAQCMRQHGISGFPDPRPTRPPNLSLGKYAEITDYMGVWILFPVTIDMQSPAWEQAAAACGPLAESFGHPHH